MEGSFLLQAFPDAPRREGAPSPASSERPSQRVSTSQPLFTHQRPPRPSGFESCSSSAWHGAWQRRGTPRTWGMTGRGARSQGPWGVGLGDCRSEPRFAVSSPVERGQCASLAGRDVETGRRREAPGRGRCLALSRFPARASVVRRSWERAPRPQGERLVPAWHLRLPFGRLLTGPPVGTLGLGSASRRHWAGFVTRGLKLLNPFEPLPRRGTLQPAFRPQILKSLPPGVSRASGGPAWPGLARCRDS